MTPTPEQEQAAREIVTAILADGEADERTHRDAVATVLATREAALVERAVRAGAELPPTFTWEQVRAIADRVLAEFDKEKP